MTASLPIRPMQPCRVSTDVDRQTAQRLDALARQYGVRRSEVVRAAIKKALDQHESA